MKKNTTRLLCSLALCGWMTCVQAQAERPADHAAHAHGNATSGAIAEQRLEGEVRKVDVAKGKVTLKHGAIANLDMPPMTMVWAAANPKMLEGLSVGDKVRFTADRVDGRYTVTTLEVVR